MRYSDKPRARRASTVDIVLAAIQVLISTVELCFGQSAFRLSIRAYAVTGCDKISPRCKHPAAWISIAKPHKVDLNAGIRGNKDNLVAYYRSLSKVVLTKLGLAIPKELREAMNNNRCYQQIQKTGTISFDPGRPPYTEQVLAIRHPKVRVVPVPRSVP